MFKNLFKKDKGPKEDGTVLLNPIAGEIVDISKVSDEVFSQKMLGDGFAVKPTGGEVYAPIGGEITVLFPTLHAISILTAEGLELLIHIGLDTVELEGKGFEAHVKLGDKVKAGDLLMTFDKKVIEDSGRDPITPIVITNMDKVESLNIDYGSKAEKEKAANVKVKN